MQRLVSISCTATDSDKARCAELAARIDATGCELAGSDDELLALKRLPAADWPLPVPASASAASPLAVRGLLIATFANAPLTARDAAVRREARERVSAILAMAAGQGVARVTLTPAIVHPHHAQSTTYAAALNHTVEALSRLAPHAETAGVQLCVAFRRTAS